MTADELEKVRDIALRLARLVDGIYALTDKIHDDLYCDGARDLAHLAHYAAHELMQALPRNPDAFGTDDTYELVPDAKPQKKRAA